MAVSSVAVAPGRAGLLLVLLQALADALAQSHGLLLSPAPACCCGLAAANSLCVQGWWCVHDVLAPATATASTAQPKSTDTITNTPATPTHNCRATTASHLSHSLSRHSRSLLAASHARQISTSTIDPSFVVLSQEATHSSQGNIWNRQQLA